MNSKKLLIFCGVLLLASCRGRQQSFDQKEAVKLSVDSLFVPDEIILGYVRQIHIEDSILYMWDLKSPQMMSALKYPTMERVCSFMVQGKGPEEMLEIGGFDLDGHYLYVMASREPKMAIYVLDSLRKGNPRPMRMVQYPNEVSPSFAFVKAGGDTVMLQSARTDSRVLVCDTAGHVLRAQYPLPKSAEECEIEAPMMPYLWLSRMTYGDGRLAVVTRLAEVLEICDPRDTLQSAVVIGQDGAPQVSLEGILGRVDGFMDVRIADGKIYAIYSGFPSEEADRILEEGGNPPSGGRYFRVYDLDTGELELVYELDRYISTFDILPDGRTVIAADPNSECQLCTFTLPG